MVSVPGTFLLYYTSAESTGIVVFKKNLKKLLTRFYIYGSI